MGSVVFRDFLDLAERHGWPEVIVLHPRDWLLLRERIAQYPGAVGDIVIGRTTFRCGVAEGQRLDLSATRQFPDA